MVITFNFEPNVSAGQEKDRKEGDVEEAKQVIEHGKADKKDVIIKPDE